MAGTTAACRCPDASPRFHPLKGEEKNKNKNKKYKWWCQYKIDCKIDGKSDRKKVTDTGDGSSSRIYGGRKGRERRQIGEKQEGVAWVEVQVEKMVKL